MDFRSVVELRDAKLGRMLARNLTVSAVSNLSGIRGLTPQDVSDDELAARYLADLFRKVPEEVSVDIDGYKAGSEIEWKEFAALCPEALDSLVGGYLEKTRLVKRAAVDKSEGAGQPEAQTFCGGQSGTVEPAERQTKQLLRIVDDSIDRPTNTLKKYMDPMGGLDVRGELEKTFGGLKGFGGLDPRGELEKTLGGLKGLGGLDPRGELEKTLGGLKGLGGLDPRGELEKTLGGLKGFGGLDPRGELEKTLGGLKGLGGLDPRGELEKTLGGLKGLGDFGISGELKSSFERTARLARDVDGALSNIHAPTPASDFLHTRLDAQSLARLENPAWETNKQLAELTGTVTQLVDVARQQAELSQAIRDSSDLALQHAIRSGEDARVAVELARKSTRLTFWAIGIAVITAIVNIALAGFTIYENRRGSTATDGRLQEEIRVLHEISGRLKQAP